MNDNRRVDLAVEVLITALQILAKHQDDTVDQRAVRLNAALDHVYIQRPVVNGLTMDVPLISTVTIRALHVGADALRDTHPGARAKSDGMLDLAQNRGWLWDLLVGLEHPLVVIRRH